jgi:hypothetical protein
MIGGVILLTGGEAPAQERPGPPPPRQMMPRPEFQPPDTSAGVPGAQMPGADPFQLLENSAEVQADLRLTSDQIVRLNRASRNFRTTLQELSTPKPGVTSDEKRAEIERHVTDTRGMIARELTPAQLGRLQQIMLQLEGPCLAVFDEPVAEQLKLSANQREVIAKACEKRSVQMQRAAVSASPKANFCDTMAENRTRAEAVRKQVDQQIFSSLDAAQKDMFARLSGKKLKLTPPMPPECG